MPDGGTPWRERAQVNSPPACLSVFFFFFFFPFRGSRLPDCSLQPFGAVTCWTQQYGSRYASALRSSPSTQDLRLCGVVPAKKAAPRFSVVMGACSPLYHHRQAFSIQLRRARTQPSLADHSLAHFLCLFRPRVSFIIILPRGRARGGKTIWRVISERPHGTGRWPFSLLSHGLSRNRADVLVPKEMRAATATVCLRYRCASLVCVCLSLGRFPALYFSSCNPSALGRLLMRDGNRPVP